MTGTTHLLTLEAIANAQETLNAVRFFPSRVADTPNGL